MNQIELKKVLAEMAASPAAFRARLLIPAPAGPRPLGRIAADFQNRDFAAMDRAFIAVAKGQKPEIPRLWVERTKGASKDTDLAACTLWLVAFSDRTIFGQVGAADRDQADELRKAAAGMLRLNPWIGEFLKVDVLSSAIVNARTDSRIDIIPADAAGSHGARPDLLILNELTHISNREFAETLLDNASKMPNGVVCIVTNAGHVGTWQEEWRQNAIDNPGRWYFSAYCQPAPWLDPAELADARRRNSANRYARLWEGRWVTASGEGISRDDINAVITLPGPLDSPERGWLYCGGLDLGLTRDASALVIIGKHVGYLEVTETDPPPLDPVRAALVDHGYLEPRLPQTVESLTIGSGRLKVARVELWRPGAGRVSIDEIWNRIKELDSIFRLVSLGVDPWQAAYLIERLQAAGIFADEVTFTGDALKSMATATLEAFSERQIDLFSSGHGEQLVDDLRALKAVEKSYGVRLESPRGPQGHGDAATALSIALHTMKRNSWQQMAEAANSGRKLVCWP